MREGGGVDVYLLERGGPHFAVEAVAGRGDNVRWECPEEEVGGWDMTEAEKGEGVLGGHGRVDQKFEDGRVFGEGRGGEGGHGVTIKTTTEPRMRREPV